jgi:hypothetical protein
MQPEPTFRGLAAVDLARVRLDPAFRVLPERGSRGAGVDVLTTRHVRFDLHEPLLGEPQFLVTE